MLNTLKWPALYERRRWARLTLYFINYYTICYKFFNVIYHRCPHQEQGVIIILSLHTIRLVSIIINMHSFQELYLIGTIYQLT